VLRTWENRFGFPQGTRTAAGHRRFSERDVDLVREVLAARDSGIPLRVAVAGVLERDRASQQTSVHAELTRLHPRLRAQRVSRRALVGVSHAIEDECLARAHHALVLGSFQEGRRFEESRRRWTELARTATWCAVLADFPDGPPPQSSTGPVCGQLPPASPLRREWTVVVLADDHAAVLNAWEVPDAGPAAYEALVSTDPAAASSAARVMVAALEQGGTGVPTLVHERLAGPAPGTANHDADRLLTRIVGYLDGRPSAAGRA
jgi:DNA-binding transcriptional MerR regulator